MIFLFCPRHNEVFQDRFAVLRNPYERPLLITLESHIQFRYAPPIQSSRPKIADCIKKKKKTKQKNSSSMQLNPSKITGPLRPLFDDLPL